MKFLHVIWTHIHASIRMSIAAENVKADRFHNIVNCVLFLHFIFVILSFSFCGRFKMLFVASHAMNEAIDVIWLIRSYNRKCHSYQNIWPINLLIPPTMHSLCRRLFFVSLLIF